MTNIDTTTYVEIKTLKEMADRFRSEDIFGHRLTYIHDHNPYDFFSVPDGECFSIDAFSLGVRLDSSNAELFKTMFYKDMNAAQGNNFFLGFDNGKYLYIDCFADNDLTLWVTERSDDHGLCGNTFRLDRFFDDYMGSTLVDVDFLQTDEFGDDDDYDYGGKIYKCGDYRYCGRLKLIFDNGKSLVFASYLGMPRITSYIGEEVDVCNYWHVASCNNLRQIWIAGQNTDDVRDHLISSFDEEFVDSIMEKVNSFNSYQLQNVWTRLCMYSHEGLSKDEVSRLVDYYIKYPAIDSRDREIMEYYAKYICDILNRRDILDEEYLLGRLDSIEKMRMLLDRITNRLPSLQGEAIKEDIEIINKEVDNEQ